MRRTWEQHRGQPATDGHHVPVGAFPRLSRWCLGSYALFRAPVIRVLGVIPCSSCSRRCLCRLGDRNREPFVAAKQPSSTESHSKMTPTAIRISILAAVCSTALAAHEREDRTLLTQAPMTAIMNEVSSERATHQVLALVPYQRVQLPSEYSRPYWEQIDHGWRKRPRTRFAT